MGSAILPRRSVVQPVEPVTRFAALVRVGEDQNRIRFHGVDDPVRVSANGLAADHGSIVRGREGACGVRPVGDVLSCLLRPVDERQTYPRFLRSYQCTAASNSLTASGCSRWGKVMR